MAIAASPDGRYLALLNAGYGTYESEYQQSIALVDTSTGKVTDFPEARTAAGMPQTLYQGLAFSSDGTHLYASFDSLSAPVATKSNETGNAIAAYRVDAGHVTPERLIPIPLQTLAAGRMQNHLDAQFPRQSDPAPAGLAVVKGSDGAEQLLVADVFSDDVLLIDAASGEVRHRFDLSTSAVVPSAYPIAVVATRDGRRGFAALWNGSAVAELDLQSGKVVGTLPLMPPTTATSPSSHPTALVLSPNQKTLYVALANRDAVVAVVVNGARMKAAGVFDTRLPGQTYFGGEPNALALTSDGTSSVRRECRDGFGCGLSHARSARGKGNAGRWVCAHGMAAHGRSLSIPIISTWRPARGRARVPTTNRSAASPVLPARIGLRPILRRCCMAQWRRWTWRNSMRSCRS